MNVDERIKRFVLVSLVGLALILITDQLYLFGIPFGGFLGDLSAYDPTGNPSIHHWMLGVVLIVVSLVALKRQKKR